MPQSTNSTSASPSRFAIAVRGVVQGVGFRPFVYNAAREEGLSGWVLNDADVVRIEVQGPRDRLEAFVETLRHGHPPQARLEQLDIEEIPREDGQAAPFQIRPSADQGRPGPTIPADLATCDACREEIHAPTERRYRYPFTNCTNCGPRWSIIRQLPYDRPRTSMDAFVMCEACRRQYDAPTDRRFHAQPIACPRCGPRLRLLDTAGKPLATEDAALQAAVEALREGRIVAMKGLGGFQLLVDATNQAAVVRLRQRKRRPDRPFALLMASLDEVRAYCDVSPEEAAALTSVEAPIMLLRRKREWLGIPPAEYPGGRGSRRAVSAVPGSLFRLSGSFALPNAQAPSHGQTTTEGDAAIADSVAPGNPYLGVMLPYTPLHVLLIEATGRPLICTSGNLSDEPMAIDEADALKRLGPIADMVLSHDRPIVRPVDDSVARVDAEGLQVLRRARGFAPRPIHLSLEGSTILAVGGHLKNAVALALGTQSGGPGNGPPSMPVILSPHIGDLDSVASVEVHRRAIEDLVGFFDAWPEVVVCDLHPDYASTRHAEALAARWRVPLLRVQHHHAHVAACMAEHGLEGPVLGLAWDGTGFGPDGTVWGGEALLCQRGEYRRVAHLRRFRLPGGDRAVRQPRRSALGLLFEILGEESRSHVAELFEPTDLGPLLTMLARAVHSPPASSLGRLFDAVAALVGLPPVISFEGQAAMALQFAADPGEMGAYPLPISSDNGSDEPDAPAVIDWEPLVRAVLADRAADVPLGAISGRFHNGLAEMAVAVARHVGCREVCLTGGCFQNALLAERVRSRLLASGFRVYTHRRVPPGDGGVALGQIFLAAYYEKSPPCASESPAK